LQLNHSTFMPQQCPKTAVKRDLLTDWQTATTSQLKSSTREFFITELKKEKKISLCPIILILDSFVV
jgi:hypothetical protein